MASSRSVPVRIKDERSIDFFTISAQPRQYDLVVKIHFIENHEADPLSIQFRNVSVEDCKRHYVRDAIVGLM